MTHIEMTVQMLREAGEVVEDSSLLENAGATEPNNWRVAPGTVGADCLLYTAMPHIEMTLQMLREAGVVVEHSSLLENAGATEPNTWRVAPGPVGAVCLLY